MMIKFYAGGASGVETAAYLEKATDHKGRPRAGVDVLRGNPHLVGQIADSLSFKHRTTVNRKLKCPLFRILKCPLVDKEMAVSIIL